MSQRCKDIELLQICKRNYTQESINSPCAQSVEGLFWMRQTKQREKAVLISSNPSIRELKTQWENAHWHLLHRANSTCKAKAEWAHLSCHSFPGNITMNWRYIHLQRLNDSCLKSGIYPQLATSKVKRTKWTGSSSSTKEPISNKCIRQGL